MRHILGVFDRVLNIIFIMEICISMFLSRKIVFLKNELINLVVKT